MVYTENAVETFFLFAIFILHSGESELYRYVLDGMSALAGELFRGVWATCLPHKGGRKTTRNAGGPDVVTVFLVCIQKYVF